MPVEGEDEVAQLAVTFNNMAANLEAIDSSAPTLWATSPTSCAPHDQREGLCGRYAGRHHSPGLYNHYLGVVSQEVGRLTRLIQNMLDISKLEAGEYQVNARSYDVWGEHHRRGSGRRAAH